MMKDFSTTAPPLEVHDLTVAYDRRPVLYGVDLTVPAGSLTGIIGPNGAGKSTLLKAVLGLLPLSAGWVKIFGGTLAQNARRTGYVPQRESVDWDFPVNVMDVVLMGRYGTCRRGGVRAGRTGRSRGLASTRCRCCRWPSGRSAICPAVSVRGSFSH